VPHRRTAKAPLWDKGVAVDAAMMRYTARDDYLLDQALLPFDLAASKAHVRGLCRIGALEPIERDALVDGLESLERRLTEGTFGLGPDDEDGHTAIEAALVEKLGDVGKRVHLGRSRNDQVLVALRLFEREALADLAERALGAARAFLSVAKAHEWTVFPGYTHLVRAVPQTVGHWAAGFAEGLGESARAMLDARARLGKCPLGAAAGYGVNLPLDREGVAHELGFEDVALNPLYSQSSRGIDEVVAVTAAWHGAAFARRFAWDISLFSTTEFGLVRLPDELTTGSSIMPNKRNPDVVELMRASCSIVQGAVTELMGLVSLPSGYQRDMQLTKAPVMRALTEARDTLTILPKVVLSLAFDTERAAAAVTVDMLATDRAVDLARGGVSFRDAYKRIAADLGSRSEPAGKLAEESVRARVSLGAPGNLGLDRLSASLDQLDADVRRAPASE
jgi:argininosuccinate lyase